MATGIAQCGDDLVTILDFEKIVAEIAPESSIQISEIDQLGPRKRSGQPVYIAEDSLLLSQMIRDSLGKAGYTNLHMVARVSGLTREKKLLERTQKALGIVGLGGVGEKYPGELSIGQARRVELARALINSPPILVLDELTANLDEDNIWDMMHVLTELNRQGTTVIMATHASMFVNIMHRRVVTLVDGRVAGDVAGGRYGEIKGRKSKFTLDH